MTTLETLPVAAPPAKVPTKRESGLWHRLIRQPVTVLSAVVLFALAVACVFAPIFTSYGPLEQDLLQSYAGPNGDHLLGTDQLGRDLLSRLLYGGRVTLLGVLQTVTVCALVGLSLGILAGTVGGWGEQLTMRFCDLLQSVPGLVILLVVLAIFGQNESAAMLTLGLLLSPNVIRVVYSATAAVRVEPYVAGARVAGLTNVQIMRRHILPAVTGPALTQLSIAAAIACLVEAGIGFLGLGVAPPQPSWGNMVTDAQQAIFLAPWMLVPAGGAIALTALSLTLLGNGVRDAYVGRSAGHGRQLSWRAMAAKVERKNESIIATMPGAGASGRTSPLLSVQGLSLRMSRGKSSVAIVTDVDFAVMPGESVGLVGESGCGKSMTISSVLRVLPPGATITAQSIEFDGTELTELSDRRMTEQLGTGIGFISQEPISSLDPAFTVGQQLVEAVRVHRKVGRREARAIALELMGQVRLQDPEAVARKYPHELSGGMAQRIAIARALAGRPRLLIADEPTTALDVSVQAEILDVLRDLRESTGMALVLVTHDWGVVAEACDRAVVMYAGEVVESAPVSDLILHPAHPYTGALLSSSPESGTPLQPLEVISGVVPAPGFWPTACRFANRCPSVHDACRVAAIPLVPAGEDRVARCVAEPDRLEAVR